MIAPMRSLNYEAKNSTDFKFIFRLFHGYNIKKKRDSFEQEYFTKKI